MHAAGAPGGHILGNFALMVREHEIHAATVDIELLAQVLLSHHRALQMPAREAFSPGRRPAHDVFRFRLLPDGKVVRRLFVVLTVQGAGTFQRGVQGAAGKDAVMVVFVIFLYIKIHGPVGFVCITGLQDLLHGLYLLDDMAGSTRLYGRRLHVEKAHGLMVAFRIILHHLHGFQLLQAGLLGNLVLPFVGIMLQMAHVRDVADIAHLIAQIFKETEQDVIGDPGPGMAQMSISIHGGSAHVHAGVALVDGLEKLLVVGESIG